MVDFQALQVAWRRDHPGDASDSCGLHWQPCPVAMSSRPLYSPWCSFMLPWTMDEIALRITSRLFTATRSVNYQKWSPRDKRITSRPLLLPHLLLSPMDYSSLKPIPLVFEPDSVYLLTVMRGDHSCPGLFHHNSDNNGVLAYADPGLPKSRSQVFSVELKQSKGLAFQTLHALN